MIEIGLDNPNKECVPIKTDYKYMLYVLKKQKKNAEIYEMFLGTNIFQHMVKAIILYPSMRDIS